MHLGIVITNMNRMPIRELAWLIAAVAAPSACGALTGWLFEGLAFFFGSLMVVGFSTVVAVFTSLRMRDTLGPPWGLVSFLLILLGGGYLGLMTNMSMTTPFDK
jgi:hypothetical protein